jgi:phospholipase/carboxylesterase
MHVHNTTDTLRFGAPLAGARAAVILVHGRGSSADDIARLAEAFDPAEAEGVAFLAPQATNNSWYPQRFLAPLAQNEPWLSSALEVVDQLVREARAAGIPSERIGLAGFSQGACLVLEYAVRHPERFAFVAGLSGALIGPRDTPRTTAKLPPTPVLVACAERDGHIPLDFVEHSAATLTRLGATVTKQIFPGGAHTVFAEEIAWLRERLAAVVG